MNNNYPKPMIIMHWITFVLVVIVYLTSGDPTRTGLQGQIHVALLHKDLKCKAPLIEPNLRRNLGKWST